MPDVRRCLASFSLIASLAAPALAAELPALPREVYFDVGGRIYRFDYSRALGACQTFAAAPSGCVEIAVTQAVFGGTPPAESFAFDGIPSPDQMALLGSSPDDVRAKTGLDLTRIVRWAPTLTHRLCRSQSGLDLGHRFGPDELRYEIPWDAVSTGTAAVASGAAIRVTINGHTAAVDAGYLDRLATKLAQGDPLRDFTPSLELEELAASLHDAGYYRSALWGLLWASEQLEQRYRWPEPSTLSQSCAWPCYQCGFSGTSLIVGGTVILTVGCGGAPATVGASCLGAGLAYLSLTHATMDSCLGCCVCLGSCLPPGGGANPGPGPGDDRIDDDRDDDRDPDDGCPARYHECCGLWCCSNDNPPDECP